MADTNPETNEKVEETANEEVKKTVEEKDEAKSDDEPKAEEPPAGNEEERPVENGEPESKEEEKKDEEEKHQDTQPEEQKKEEAAPPTEEVKEEETKKGENTEESAEKVEEKQTEPESVEEKEETKEEKKEEEKQESKEEQKEEENKEEDKTADVKEQEEDGEEKAGEEVEDGPMTGTFLHYKSEHLEEFLQEMGINWLMRKVLNNTNPTIVIKQKGEEFQLTLKTGPVTRDNKFSIGVPFVEKGITGSLVKVSPRMEDGKLVQYVEPKEGEQGKPMQVTREVKDDQLIMTMEVDKIVCTRYFKRQS